MLPAKIFKVFVSSTFEDLREERGAIQRALLQLNCLPVGTELFPAADSEAWEFIQLQIEDCDYYVVVLAGRYGSLAEDGTSYTEKEYDYALSLSKPGIGFVHSDPGKIQNSLSERDPALTQKLNDFRQKVMRRMVRPYSNPDQLATEVTTSFVKLLTSRPAEGFVRASQAIDPKRYADLLERCMTLEKDLAAKQKDEKELLSKLDKTHMILVVDEEDDSNCCYQPKMTDLFCLLANILAVRPHEFWVARALASALMDEDYQDNIDDIHKSEVVAYLHPIKMELLSLGLIDLRSSTYCGKPSQIWALTDNGRRLLRELMDQESSNGSMTPPAS